MLAQLPPPGHDPEEVRRLADEILSRSEFGPPRRGLIERIVRWILDRLADLFDEITPGDAQPGATGGSNFLSSLILLVALVAVIAVVVVVIRRGGLRRKPKTDDDVEVDIEERRSVSAWEREAVRLEGEGQWKQGLRCRFGALVERLRDDGVVPAVPGRTSGEYRIDVRATLPERADDFAGAAELFERAWYGDLPTGPDEATRFAGHAERVLTAAGER